MLSKQTIANWEALHEALGSLPAEGADGFEGFISRLFEAETGQKFYLARRGDQPAGDVYGPMAKSVLQAKRYVRSDVSANNVEGDIDRALRDVPGLDVFVVAITKEQNQLKLRLETKSTETGLDIVYLVLGGPSSGLGALCVEHWAIVREFFPTLDESSNAWARSERDDVTTQESLKLRRAEMCGLATRKLAGDRAAEERIKSWGPGGVSASAHNRVRLQDAIPRLRFQRRLEDWWHDAKIGFAVVEGEEGCGKTWVAAAFSESLRTSGVVVFWLDSVAWASARSVEEIIRIALSGIFPPGDDRVRRLWRKVFLRWNEPVLVMLDGANERDGWETKERLLYDYRQHAEELLPRVRLLFTSRPLEHRPRAGKNFWEGAKIISVGGFDQSEFEAALARFAPDVQPGELTDRVRELAVIPRYFQLCIRLKERLCSLSHLNKQVVLWADLEEKLSHRDPQWLMMGAELNGSPAQILAHLAQRIGWPAGASVTVTNEELRRHLPDFQKVRADLAEQRVVVGGDLGVTHLSADHLILGWALALRAYAEAHNQDTGDDLCDGLQRLLEPAASNDDKARAVHVAALLTLLPEGGRDLPERIARIALIRLWASHHNATISAEALQFFVDADLSAYIGAVEAFFRTHLAGDFESTLIQPLARAWRDERGDIDALRAVLVRWLSLIFPGDASGSKDRAEAPPARFQAAASAEQLRLSYAAIGIISFRPERQLLPALADCYRSDDYCYADLDPRDEKHRFSLKSPIEPLGILARWHYGESALSEIAQMANGVSTEGVEWKNLHWFARMWRAVELPPILGAGADTRRHDPKSASEPFWDFCKYLDGSDTSKTNLIGLGYMERLAVRRDLPSLSETQVTALIADVRSRLAHLAKFQNVADTWEQRGLDDLLPWVARYAKPEFEEAMVNLWMAAIHSPETLPRLLNIDEMIPAKDFEGCLVSAVRSHVPQILEQKHTLSAAVPLTELMLLHATPEQLIEWLRHLETEAISGRSGCAAIGILPLPTAFQYLAPVGLDTLARAEADAALERLAKTPTDPIALRISRHWLQAFAYVVEPTQEVVEWALALADSCQEDDELRFPLFAIASRTDHATLLIRALFLPAFREYHLGYNSWRWAQAFPRGGWPAFTFAELEGRVSLTASGWLLLRGKQDNELQVWGQTLAKHALAAVSAEIDSSPKTQIHVHVGRDEQQEGYSFTSPPSGGQNWHGLSSPAWGVDRQVNKPAASEADFDRELTDFKEDMDARRKSLRREFTGFNAVGPLRRWGELQPEEFVRFAEDFLPRVKEGGLGFAFDFAFFAQAVAIVLLEQRPGSALLFGEWTKQKSPTPVLKFGGALAWSTHELWKPDLNESAVVNDARRKMLCEAPHDEELLWHALAAEACDNSPALVALAIEWASERSAAQRALAVSLLAFQGDDASRDRLANLRDSDPSYWIREHATWAWEVCSTEIACRRRYREILQTRSLDEIAAGLAEIRMALSPIVYAWHSPIDAELIPKEDRRVWGYVKLFWYHWGNTSSRKENIKLCGRKLQQHCRGENLKDGVTSKMAPWWNIDETFR